MKKQLFTLGAALAMSAIAAGASAAPQAHILPIDPTAGVANGTPILTTVIEVVQFNRLSDALTPCAAITGYEQTLDCWSKAIEKPGALWSPFPFPEANAHFFVNVAGSDTLTKFDSKEQWGTVVGKEAGVGTAWLVALDASNGMGSRYADARVVAEEFIKAMQPNDLMDLMIFDDRPRQYVADSKWKTFAQRNDLIAVLNQIKSPMPSHGSDRPLFSQIQQMTQDSFGDLGSSKGPQMIPLHQAMVVLSDGSGHGDPASLSPTAGVFAQYLDQGRFPADNTSLPKTPLPVISIWFPSTGGFANSLYKDNDSQFMQSLANTEIGGYFDIVRGGQGTSKATTIIGLVKQRFNAMWIVKWRLSCLNPTVTQSFNLVFQNTNPVIAPDGSFKDVPIGVDPTVWPLDVDVAKTVAESQTNPVYPGGTFRVYGDFCWGGDKTRAEAYFVPAGTAPNPNANSADPSVAKQAMQTLIAENMRGAATDVGDEFAVFNVPNDAKLLDGTGDNAVARVVIYDNKASRTSGHDAKSILTLHAKTAPFNILLVAGIGGGVVVIGLLVVVLMRGGGGGGGGGGGKKRRGNTPPPAPVVAGGGAPPYGAPPPPGGGYQASAGQQGGAAFDAAQAALPQQISPQMAFDSTALASGGASPAVVQVRCPACSMMTMATPGQAAVCFSCGQPLPAGAAAQGGGAGAYAPTFPLTGGMPMPPQPPANPYGAPLAAMNGQATGGYVVGATIFGPSGQFAIRPGSEMRVGRDPAQCGVFLQEPRVSGWHSTLKFEGGRLWVRDEGSNNGTYVDGARIAAQTWTPVTPVPSSASGRSTSACATTPETPMSGETQITLPAVDVAERSDPGRDPTKQINEDSFGHRETPFGVLAVVCDGMGGHVGGREASTAGIATIFEGFEKAPLATPAREVLRDAIRLANVRVRGLALSDPGGGRPGSTVVAVLVHARGTEVAHVGDSRVYLVQQGQIFQITRDHSMVQEMVEAKILTPDQAAVHPDANKITRALGIEDDVQVEVRQQPIAHVAGDAFILCSDGLSDLVEPHEILAIVSSDPPEQAVGKLVDLANARGGHDNITVVIVKPRVSAPAGTGGGVAATVIDTMTLRPPAAPPFGALAPLTPSILSGAPPAMPPPSARSRTPRPAPPRSRVPLVAVAVGVVLVAALFWMRTVARREASAPARMLAVNAGIPAVDLTAPPTASVNLAPAALPAPSEIDASEVAPLEPVPSAPVRHSRGKSAL